jgi:tRNA threonylcarbamoyladenosine biosynthesis protein TsaB
MSTPATHTAILAIESSNRRVGAALWGHQGLIGKSADAPTEQMRKHGADLAPIVQGLLKNAGLQPRDLRGISISLGPGSWTGLRVGLALAKALAWGANVELTGVSSFETLALQISRTLKSPARLLTLRNAYSEGHFAAAFLLEPGNTPERLCADTIVKPEALPGWIDALPGPAVLLCGDVACQAALESTVTSRGWKWLPEHEEIEPAILAELAYGRINRGEGLKAPEQIHLLAPLYLRASDPELKLQRNPA